MCNVIQGQKICLAIMGCGRISRNHFGSIDQYPEELELAAIWDVNPDVLQKYQ